MGGKCEFPEPQKGLPENGEAELRRHEPGAVLFGNSCSVSRVALARPDPKREVYRGMVMRQRVALVMPPF